MIVRYYVNTRTSNLFLIVNHLTKKVVVGKLGCGYGMGSHHAVELARLKELKDFAYSLWLHDFIFVDNYALVRGKEVVYEDFKDVKCCLK